MSLITLFDNIFGLRKVERITTRNNATTIGNASESLSFWTRIYCGLPSMQIRLVSIPTRCTSREPFSILCLRLWWFENGGFLFGFFMSDKRIHSKLLDILLEIPLQLINIRVLFDPGHLGHIRVVEVADVVFLDF